MDKAKDFCCILWNWRLKGLRPAEFNRDRFGSVPPQNSVPSTCPTLSSSGQRLLVGLGLAWHPSSCAVPVAKAGLYSIKHTQETPQERHHSRLSYMILDDFQLNKSQKLRIRTICQAARLAICRNSMGTTHIHCHKGYPNELTTYN